MNTPLTPDEVLQHWLREALGIAEYRRVVRDNETTIVISKFEAGFSQELFSTMDLLPEILDEASVETEYRKLAEAYRAAGEAPSRTQVWRDAAVGLMERLGEERAIPRDSLDHILPGIESVQAMLDTILWSMPTIADRFEPSKGEVEAYEEFLADETGRIFTRFYGDFHGRSVENYCPGSQFARRFVTQAWHICTRQESE